MSDQQIESAKPAIAFPNHVPVIWDLDYTLLPANVGGEFIRFLLRQKEISRSKRYRFYLAYLLFHSRVLTSQRALREAHQLFVGLDADLLTRMAHKFVETHIEPLFFPGAIARLNWHRSRQDDLILISGSPEFLVKQIGSRLGFNQAVGTRYAINNGLITAVVPPICYGSDKVVLLKELYPTTRRPHVYTDDVMDFPLLELARSASLVNPTKTFIAQAESLSIPIEILRWTQAVGELNAH